MIDKEEFKRLYELGYSDTRISEILRAPLKDVRDTRLSLGLPPNYRSYQSTQTAEMILSVLEEGPAFIEELSEITGYSKQTISQYYYKLRQAGVPVERLRLSRMCIMFLEPHTMIALRRLKSRLGRIRAGAFPSKWLQRLRDEERRAERKQVKRRELKCVNIRNLAKVLGIKPQSISLKDGDIQKVSRDTVVVREGDDLIFYEIKESKEAMENAAKV